MNHRRLLALTIAFSGVVTLSPDIGLGAEPGGELFTSPDSSIRPQRCRGSAEPGGPCSTGPGGGLSSGPGGGRYTGPGGGLYEGPGGGLYSGPGGGMYRGPKGGLSTAPGGGMYSGPGGPLFGGRPDPNARDAYKGPWSPCLTGVMGAEWTEKNCRR